MHFISICVSATPADFKWVTQQLCVGQSRKPKGQRANYCRWQPKENCLLMIPSRELSSESQWCQNTTSSYSGIVPWIGVKLFCFVIKWSLIGNPIHKRRWSLRAVKLLGPLKSELWTEAGVQLCGLSFEQFAAAEKGWVRQLFEKRVVKIKKCILNNKSTSFEGVLDFHFFSRWNRNTWLAPGLKWIL